MLAKPLDVRTFPLTPALQSTPQRDAASGVAKASGRRSVDGVITANTLGVARAFGTEVDAHAPLHGTAPLGWAADQVAAPRLNVPIGDAPTKGPADAPVTIIVFSDFECPFCGRAQPGLRQLEEQYAGKVRFAFKQRPLPTLHPDAELAAEASMAANAQGKFWEYHDKLFANQQALDRASLERYAKDVGLDVEQFRAALDSRSFKGAVEADVAQAEQVGIRGTPTFLVNGQMVKGAKFDELTALIEEELRAAEQNATAEA